MSTYKVTWHRTSVVVEKQAKEGVCKGKNIVTSILPLTKSRAKLLRPQSSSLDRWRAVGVEDIRCMCPTGNVPKHVYSNKYTGCPAP
jgi:hypothetical protein